MAESTSLLPAVEKLAVVQEGNSAHMLRDKVKLSIEEATIHIVQQLDDLITEIEKIKSHLIVDASALKAGVQAHFDLGAEALAFRDKVQRKLWGIANGAKEETATEAD